MHANVKKVLIASIMLAGYTPFFAYGQSIIQVDIPYTDVPQDTDSTLLSLDVYTPLQADNLPVIVWVHGGAWAFGDKSSVNYKSGWLNSNDYVFVSVNYRLSPFPVELDNPDRIKHPIHAEDVAAAVGFVRQEAASWGGNPDQIGLMGHSAGGHLVSLVATDTRYLAAHGMAPSDLYAVISLDAGAYNVADIMTGGLLMDQYLNAFTKDPAVWADASPINYVTTEVELPPFLLVHQTNTRQTNAANSFAAALEETGNTVTTYPAFGMSHEDINRWLGGSENPTYTADVLSFIEESLPPSVNVSKEEEVALNDGSIVTGPNPTRNYVTLSLSHSARIFVVDMLGRVVIRRRGQRGEFQVDLRSLPQGVYMVVVIQNGQRHIERVILL